MDMHATCIGFKGIMAVVFSLLLVAGGAYAQDPCDPDETPPIIECTDIVLVLDGDGMANLFAAGALYTTAAIASIYDECDGSYLTNPEAFSISAEPSTFTCEDVGSVEVQIVVADSSGNQAVCTVNVTIEDPDNVCDVPEGEPVEGEVEGEPAEGEVEGEPAEGEVEGEPAEGEVEGEPVEGEVEGEPVVEGEVEGEPVVDEGEGEPVDPVDPEPCCAPDIFTPGNIFIGVLALLALLVASLFLTGHDPMPPSCN